jgi:hypothetical protein
MIVKRLYFAIMSVVCFHSVFSGCKGLTGDNGAVTAADVAAIANILAGLE